MCTMHTLTRLLERTTRTLTRALWPSRWKLALFVFFCAVVAGGYVQSYAFIDDMPGAPPEPPLYGVLRVLPLWPIAVVLLLPLLALFGVLQAVGVFQPSAVPNWSGESALVAALTGAYLYALASGVVELVCRSRPARHR